MTANKLTILGIDPGYDRLGWAVYQGESREIAYGCIQTLKSNDVYQRYAQLDQDLEKILQKYHPQHAAIESLFFFKNKTTVIKVSEARGIVLGKLVSHKLKIDEYTPLQIKQAVTGYGRADKKAVEKMVRMHFQIPSQQKIIDDAIDALAVIITHQVSSQNHKYYA